MPTPTMKRWSDAKLDKELSFAIAALDEKHPATVTWLEAIRAEIERRMGQ